MIIWFHRLITPTRKTGPNDKFTCPRCGGRYFTTPNGDNSIDHWTGLCLDQYNKKCTFSWKRKDDYLFFAPGPTMKGSIF